MTVANLIKQLREKTGAGMMDCRNALVESNNDFETAVEWLRKKGLAAAAKKSSRSAAQGLVTVEISEDGKTGTAIEVNSETDFVALNDRFQNLVEQIAAVSGKVNTIEELHETHLQDGKSVKDAIIDNIASIGENLLLRRMEKASVTNGVIASYVHGSVKDKLGKIGVLVALESTAGDHEALQELGKKLAMHIAAAKPLYLTKEEVPAEAVEKEKAIFVEQCRASGKPENIINNMVQGKINNFYNETVLLEQVFVMDNKTAIKDVLANASKSLNAEVKLVKFVRLELGEGVEVEQSDFAKDVQAMVK